MHRLKNTILLLLIIVLAASSCKSILKKDLSLTVDEYRAKGMPDIDSVWSEKELIKAHVTLGSLRIKNFMTLPRQSSRKSGAVFSRIISVENLSFLNDTSIALHEKAYQIQTISSFLNEIARMYTDNLHPEQYYSRELIAIFGREIYVREQMLELAEKIMNSDDPADISMRQGRPAIVGGYVNLISTLLKNEAKTRSFSAGELRSLAREVSLSPVKNIKYLDPRSKQKISAEIESLAEKNKSAYIGRNFAEVLKSLKD